MMQRAKQALGRDCLWLLLRHKTELCKNQTGLEPKATDQAGGGRGSDRKRGQRRSAQRTREQGAQARGAERRREEASGGEPRKGRGGDEGTTINILTGYCIQYRRTSDTCGRPTTF